MTTNIYILKLEQNKYYVGKSKNVAQRYQEHLLGQGSTWTRKYKPVKLDTVIENASPFDEDKQVKIYMEKFGIDNVRGGSYVTDVLTEEQTAALKAEIWGSSDLCNKCGRKSHFYKDCYAYNDTDGNVLIEPQPNKMELISTVISAAVSAAIREAIASLDLLPKSPKKKVIKKPIKDHLEQNEQQADECHRCGRTGHYSKGCYAKTHRDGHEI